MRHRLRRLALPLASFVLLTLAFGAGASTARAQPALPEVPSTTPAAPMIMSTGPNVYQNGVAMNFVGTPGQFTLSDPGSTVTGYDYSFTNGLLGTFVPAGPDGTVTLRITPYDESALTLYAAAVNGSNPPSAQSSFVIETITKANHTATLAWWKLNAGHGRAAVDSTGDLHTAFLHKDASLSCGTRAAPDGYRCTMRVGGQGGQGRTAPAILPIVGNNGNFSVSVWVNLSKCSSSCVALSFDATQTDEFALSFKRKCTANGTAGPCWMFSMPVADSTSATVLTAASAPGSAKLGKWTQLTGTFDAGHTGLTLYVNGTQAGQVTGVSPWSSVGNGRARIGNLLPGGSTHDWQGRLSNVCIFFGVLQASDVTLLHKGDSQHPHNGCAALLALYP